MDATRLKRIPVFADLSDDALKNIAALAAEVSVPESTGHMRASRNTPSFTIVAECR